MTEIDVEAVEDIGEEAVPEGVDAPEYVLYGGKGGVGKTTMAAATGLASARDGTATLVVSTDPAHSLSDTLETDIPAEPARIRDDVPLYAAEIDPEAAMGDGPLGVDSGLGGLEEMLGDDVADPLGGSMPGADEAAAMRLLLEYMDDPRFDRVVVDTAPTGHTLRLLELPELMDSMVGRLLTFRERIGGMVDSFTGMFGGDDQQEDLGDLEDLEVLRERIERLRAVLRDPSKTDFRVVMVPEELSVVESERLLDRLEEFGVPVGTVVVNRVMEDLTDVADVDADWFVSPNVDHCEFCERRWKVQQEAIKRSQSVFRGHEVRRVPLFADEVRGEKLLRVVAACLER
ncbi:TRC40/GET3/ArsA family transport-energizing ATPase [Haloarculaceae archaeon H-GB2-1]|nr:TRC40/GET3/ArsA family transport-energizing ATPase [Haloarculaceae archaeon H-GB1-1]MEA5386259.1 TRC40/GET3/ArsA family transport-energizing ATPase [Haloarculaceae archaeon H-GB11]MEA5407762.1 TRC40/GET3/ArsA family transport-energizing ATPase [Haloarculaceae archaeon H-GB2-1]